MQILLGKHWHHLKIDQIEELLETRLDSGLDVFEVTHRLERFGENRLEAKKKESPLLRFAKQFNHPLMILLVVSSIITAVVKDLLDAGIIFAAVLVNAVVSYLQESRAEAAIEALASSLASDTTVLRTGESKRIPAAQLVPGDVVVLSSGDRVPADLRIVSSKGLQISEAALTGESVPSDKSHDLLLPVDTLLADRRNMAYSTTLVTSGSGKGIVTATGASTEIGRISQLISTAEQIRTPLTKKIAGFSKLVLVGILVLAGAVLSIGLLRGDDFADTVVASIALAVAMIPEGLPTALTVTLAIGVQRMAQRRAIIRRLPAVEALGSTTVICSDKTGTLTQNQMTVTSIFADNQIFELSGSGYRPEGMITSGSETVKPQFGSPLHMLLLSGLLCNDASLNGKKDGDPDISGDPTEIALLVSGLKGGLSQAEQTKKYPRLDVIPFDSKHQYMATLHEIEGQKTALIKGAVEVLLARSSGLFTEKGKASAALDKDAINAQADRMAAQGMRVLAFAIKKFPASTTALDENSLGSDWIFLGLQAIIDPPRAEAAAAVAACHQAGISVKMITGDHPLTAAAIAREIGIISADENGVAQTLSGKDLAALSDQELIEKIATVNVFSRVSPDQKLRLVDALQARGHVVSMTGDGVNDGPALKQADIGIAMGITGTDVAKEASDMVLTDDNFATIETAVEEGRSIFDNILKIISWTLPTNIGEGLIILVALLLGEVLPIIPIQILWINMVTVTLLGIVLALEKKEPGIMERPPREPSAPIIEGWLAPRILFVGLMILVSGFALFEWELGLGASLETARAVAVNAVIFMEIFFIFNSRSLVYSPFKIGFFSNRWLIGGVALIIVLQMLFTYAPFMNAIFGSAPLGFDAWWRLMAFGVFTFSVVELEKWLRRRKATKRVLDYSSASISNQ